MYNDNVEYSKEFIAYLKFFLIILWGLFYI